MSSEKALVQKAKAGDRDAFAALVSAYEGKIYNLALRYLGNREDAMDASQEVFLRVFRFLPGFQEESGFSTWIYRIGVNVCKDMLAKRAKRGELSLELPDEEEDYRTAEVADSRYDPEAIVEQADLRESLAEAIGQLPQQQREMIVLRDIQGLSYEEIGQVLSLEAGTVKSRLSRARENLRKKLLQSGNIFGVSPSKLSKGGKTDAIL
ncbi:MAG: sigma-70 family RNA polymerase sigma factor [Clostridia bacterium]|nr:sigma-70 family RNA polymerase sigma factor [Clostridia bacterium]MBR6573724.1 sigma-70 family RNA polymerase sigma factor [Clostridia bacterium]